MKIPAVLVLSIVLGQAVLGADALSLAFPQIEVGKPSLSLLEAVKPAPLLPALAGPTGVFGQGGRPTLPSQPKFQMRILSPKPGVDYKLLVKSPDEGVDYKLRVIPFSAEKR